MSTWRLCATHFEQREQCGKSLLHCLLPSLHLLQADFDLGGPKIKAGDVEDKLK
jgi:hypothetical protein